MTFLCLPLITVIYARLQKAKTLICLVYFEDEHELISFSIHVTRFDGKTKLKNLLLLDVIAGGQVGRIAD
jgi:hypothetical protein